MSSDRDMVSACPFCDDTSSVNLRTHALMGQQASDDRRWRCGECGETFDRPRRREARATGPSAAAILERFGLEPIDTEGDDE